MYRSFSILSALLFLFLNLFSNDEKGYDIRFTIEGLPEKMLYIEGNYGEQVFIFDSVKVKQGKLALFKDKQRLLPAGIYRVVDKEGRVIFPFIIDQVRRFSIYTLYDTPITHAEITGSEENVLFFEYLKMLDTEDLSNIFPWFETAPASLLSKYIRAEHMALDIPTPDENNPEIAYQYLIDHFFDNIDFGDARLLRTPLSFEVDFFFTRVIDQNPDTLIKEFDQFMNQTVKSREVKAYFLSYFLNIFDSSNPLYDAVLVHIYDHYCPDNRCDWMNSESLSRRFSKTVERKRKLLPGQSIPPLAAYDIHKNLLSTKDISRDYILLWFWDPDCDDCTEETPKLHQFFDKYKDVYDFDVFAVSVTEDFDRWERFINEHLLNWINVSFSMGEPNYDFIDYFDLFTTPAIYLIDKKHTIITRQFPLDELHEKFHEIK